MYDGVAATTAATTASGTRGTVDIVYELARTPVKSTGPERVCRVCGAQWAPLYTGNKSNHIVSYTVEM